MHVPGTDEPLGEAEREELQRLRQRVAALTGDRGTPPRPADMLLVLVALLSVSAVLARFTRSEFLDADRYVEIP